MKRQPGATSLQTWIINYWSHGAERTRLNKTISFQMFNLVVTGLSIRPITPGYQTRFTLPTEHLSMVDNHTGSTTSDMTLHITIVKSLYRDTPLENGINVSLLVSGHAYTKESGHVLLLGAAYDRIYNHVTGHLFVFVCRSILLTRILFLCTRLVKWRVESLPQWRHNLTIPSICPRISISPGFSIL
jgi:hypothetical protein